MKAITSLLIMSCLLITNVGLSEELSRKDLESIGEKYCQAWKTGDLENLKVLFLNPDKLTQKRFNRYKASINEIEVDAADDGHVLLEVELKKRWPDYEDMYGSNEGQKWLLITPDGKIKYDSILLKHPVELALQSIPIIDVYGNNPGAFASEEHFRPARQCYAVLKKTGVPLFGLEVPGKPNDVEESLIELGEWIFDDGDEWDATEPKVFLPRDLLKDYKNTNRY